MDDTFLKNSELPELNLTIDLNLYFAMSLETSQFSNYLYDICVLKMD
jgi:hypothetical protein